MNFSDVFKGKFLSQVGSISAVDAVISLAIAIALGLVIFLVYKKTFSGVMYSSSFNMSLLLMVVITSVIILTISSNVVLSLGMVGALSIIRFRTVIKDPVDIMYLFWAISIGIIVGAHQYLFALICVVVIAVLCFVMSMLSTAFFASRKAASSIAAGEPMRVKTQRLWLPSLCTSKSVQPGTALAVSTRA